MIAEGQVPKKIQMYKPSTHNPATKNNISSNKESLRTTDEDPMIEKSLSSISSTTSTTYWKSVRTFHVFSRNIFLHSTCLW